MSGVVTKRKRILIIDDDDVHLASTRGLLEEEGYEVYTQLGPFGATTMVKSLRPDLVLLDVNMPGLPGDRLSVLLRDNEATASTRLILYSSNDEDILRATVRAQGLDGYICKGSPSQLRSKVKSFLA